MTELISSTDALSAHAIADFQQRGGCLDFAIYQLAESEPTEPIHYAVARQAALAIAPPVDLDRLAGSGRLITNQAFLGSQYELSLDKPIVRGATNRFINDYFYFDAQENRTSRLDFNRRCEAFEFVESDGATMGFASAFLEPPYPIDIGRTMLERGTYLIRFCDCLFTDLRQIEVYCWSVDCSPYFEAGKEWWGAHFWTVYNPARRFGVGVLASTTD